MKSIFPMPGNYCISLIVLLFLSFSLSLSYAQTIKIGLYPENDIKACVFSVVSGAYTISGDNIEIVEARPGDIFFIKLHKNQVVINDSIRQVGKFKTISLTGINTWNVFQLRTVSPFSVSYDYDDNLELSISNNRIQLINNLGADNYISGVVEAEGGPNAYPEFYKAQAILVRTYLYKNKYRHGMDGFNLCNEQHCQAYKGRSMQNRQIHEAVKSTSGLVLSDTGKKLIVAPYHSNCGGLTCKPEQVWQNYQPCLYSIRDPFCSGKNNSTWTKKIPLAEWNDYMVKNNIGLPGIKSSRNTFENTNRKMLYREGNSEIALKKIREDFHLKSAFFSFSTEGNNVILNGRGYGHGVGMCQEGAMEMAKAGYRYTDILHFYFQNILITEKKE